MKLIVKEYNENNWYISSGRNKYLHKDIKIHNYCGKENMFNSKEEAKKFLNEYLNPKKSITQNNTSNFTISEDILFYAFRYCLGRMTYAVSECVQHLIINWPNLKACTQALIHSEIREAISKNWAGMECDVEEWNKILKLKIKE